MLEREKNVRDLSEKDIYSVNELLHYEQDTIEFIGKREFSSIEELKHYIQHSIEIYFFHTEMFYRNEETKFDELCEAAENVTKALFEDLCIHVQAQKLWNKMIKFELKDSEHNLLHDELKEIYNKSEKLVWEIAPDYKVSWDIEPIEKVIDAALSDGESGIPAYASRGILGSMLKSEMKIGYAFLTKCIHPELYKKIYPVFWLELLDANRSKNTLKKVDYFYESLINPIALHRNLEGYIFSLLLNKRTRSMRTDKQIFTLIRDQIMQNYRNKKDSFKFDLTLRKEQTEQLEDFKKVEESLQQLKRCTNFNDEDLKVYNECTAEIRDTEAKIKAELEEDLKTSDQDYWKKLDMNLQENREEFVLFYREELMSEQKEGKMNKKVLENNLRTLKELIQIGRKYGMPKIDAALFLYFLNRLTGWIGFYFYVNVKSKGNAECLYNFFNMDDKLALSYCWKKYFKDINVGRIRNYLSFLEDIYDKILEIRKSLSEFEDCDYGIYKMIYDELFEDDKKICTGVRIDVLNYYYDKYTRDWDKYETEQIDAANKNAKNILNEMGSSVYNMAFDEDELDEVKRKEWHSISGKIIDAWVELDKFEKKRDQFSE